MRRRELQVRETAVEDELLPILRDRVFHITTAERLTSIQRAGAVSANRDGTLGNSFPQSVNSVGRHKGWVCLYDLRVKDEKAVRWGLDVMGLAHPLLGCDFVYLIVAPEAHSELVLPRDVPWDEKRGKMYIPEVECWYPADLPLEQVQEALIVRVKREPLGGLARLLSEVEAEKPQEGKDTKTDVGT